MAKYELRREDRGGTGVRIRRKKLELHWPALAVCLLLAVLLWLYVVNGGLRQTYPNPPAAESDAEAESLSGQDAAADAAEGR